MMVRSRGCCCCGRRWLIFVYMYDNIIACLVAAVASNFLFFLYLYGLPMFTLSSIHKSKKNTKYFPMWSDSSSCWAGVALLVLCTSVFHICEAFQATHRSQPYFGRPLSTFKQRQLRVSATAATSIASSLPPSSPLLPTQTAGRILIVTESAVKSTTIRNLLQLLPAAFQSHYQFVVQTCPQNVTTLTPIKKSVRSTVKDVSEMDFTVAVDSLLYPAYEIVQSKSAIETVGEIQQTLGNISQILLAFDMDRRGEHLSWQLLSVLHVPQNVTLSRLKLTELTPSNFQSCLTNALSPPRNHRSDYEKQLLDMNIVESQLTEQVVDRTISFALSQALYKCQGGYHKLGRLPCAILNLIAKRENELDRIKLTPAAYTLRSKFKMKLNPLHTRLSSWVYLFTELCSVNNRTVVCSEVFKNATGDVNDSIILDLQQVTKIAELCDRFSTKFKVSSCNNKLTIESPPKPLNFAALLVLSAQFLHLSPRETLLHSQSLYEKGFITFPNTACSEFTASEYEIIQKAAAKRFGVGNVNTRVQDVRANADAEEAVAGAIRPVFRANGLDAPVDSALDLDEEEINLFNLILKNTFASVMRPARQETTVTIIEASLPRRRMRDSTVDDIPIFSCAFNSTKMTILDPGYRIAFLSSYAKNDTQYVRPMPKSGDTILTTLIGAPAFLAPVAVKAGQSARRGKRMSQVFRKMPALGRFTLSTLISELSSLGCIDEGVVPHSTMEAMHDLKRNSYLQLHPRIQWSFGGNRNNQEGEIQPSKKGIFMVHYLKKAFEFLLYPFFSSTVQEQIGAIENGSLKKDQLVDLFAFGANKTQNVTVSAHTPLPLVPLFRDGFFRFLSERVKSKLHNGQPPQTLSAASYSPLVKPQYLGKDPVTKLPVHIRHRAAGFFVHIGHASSSAGTEGTWVGKQYALPSWITPDTVMITTVKEALSFVNLPRTIYHHPSTRLPITLFLLDGLLWLQLGNVDKELSASTAACRLPLEAGLFPSDITKEMALNKLNSEGVAS